MLIGFTDPLPATRSNLASSNKHAYAGQLNSFTHLRALLVLPDGGVFSLGKTLSVWRNVYHNKLTEDQTDASTSVSPQSSTQSGILAYSSRFKLCFNSDHSEQPFNCLFLVPLACIKSICVIYHFFPTSTNLFDGYIVILRK
jgi:hypothetical protein